MSLCCELIMLCVTYISLKHVVHFADSNSIKPNWCNSVRTIEDKKHLLFWPVNTEKTQLTQWQDTENSLKQWHKSLYWPQLGRHSKYGCVSPVVKCNPAIRQIIKPEIWVLRKKNLNVVWPDKVSKRFRSQILEGPEKARFV